MDLCYTFYITPSTPATVSLKVSGKTFKVVTNRSNKAYPIKSMEMNNIIGGHILKNTNFKVDVHNPDITIHIEIRENTYIYLNEINTLSRISR